ncbi:MAG: ATP-dependent Clp protease ATP-binding subunit [Blastocatellia bacterium]|nr:ATP-dependent Clp protease ATP-binding subunit [Blastocatellia bacterium]
MERFPVLVWEDFQGNFTASLLDTENSIAAYAATADEALLQLKDYISWLYDKNPWQILPDLSNPKMLTFRVDIRPEYRVSNNDGEDRIYPCEQTFPFHVVAVYGQQESGNFLAILPTLNIHFYYYEESAIKGLVTHYTEENLKGLTPREVARLLPPKKVFLEELTVNISSKNRDHKSTSQIEIVAEVAEPIGEKSLLKRYGKAWEREPEVADLVERIKKEKPNIIILGEPGSGKSTLLADAVRQIEKRRDENDDDENRFEHKFWLSSSARLISGMKYLGQWEERCEQVIAELANIDGYLCIENLLDLIKVGGSSSQDSLAMFFIPYLKRRELRLIAEATPSELDACRRLLPGFADLFQIIKLQEFTRDKAVTVLDRTANSLKHSFSVEVDPKLPDMVYRLFKRFAPYQSFPGKSVEFVRGLFDKLTVSKNSLLGNKDVINQFIQQTGLSELFLVDELPLHPDNVLNYFRSQVIGQEEACQIATNLVTTFKAGLNDPNRPIGVFLFCGPTGVGKTELAKAISRFFFGHNQKSKDERFIRLDMSEYSGFFAAERFLGDKEPSEWIKKVRHQPFVVILLDEIEKASPEVFDAMLSLFDEGRITDKYGRVTYFRSAVIIMTSNIGADKLDLIGFGKTPPPSYTSEAMSFFRPEFYNRIDTVVRFNPLNQQMILEITEKELAQVAKREAFSKTGVKLFWTKDLVLQVAKEGFDPRYGARPLQRTIESLVVAPLAHQLLIEPLTGKKSVEISLDNNKKLLSHFT